jgi:ATP-binding cassette subfamily B protein
VEELMQQKPMNEPEEEVPFANYHVEFQNVSFSYDDTPTVQNVSFQAKENSLTAIVGMSGSGKSTLMQLLMRYWDSNEGVITIGGKPIQSYRIDALMSSISVVFQQNYLFRDSIFQNIRMGKPTATKEEVMEAARCARCHDFIMDMPDGYDTLVEEGGKSLSGGECQRIAIARAILKDAPIVILDEATSGIDPVNEADIQRAIEKLAKGKTVFVIAHKFAPIQDADQILVLEQGRLIEQGKHDALLQQNGRYASLWKKQQGVDDWKIRWDDED